MDDLTGTHLQEMRNLNGEMSINNPSLKSEKRILISPLIRAVRRGLRITEKYLNEQKDVEKLKVTDTDITGRNIFHLSVQREELLEFVLEKFEKHDHLIQALFSEDVNGYTPAHIAVLHNERKHAYTGRPGQNMYTIRSRKTGQTLIHCAVKSCNPYIVQDILEARPDALYDKDNDGKSTQHYAAALEEWFLLEFLLSHGADIFETDKNNSTPFHMAADAGSLSNVKLLFHEDEDLLRAEDNQGRTALHIACMNGCRNIVSFLLKNGADPLVRMEGGLNCLEVAVMNKQDDVVKELLLSDHWKDLITEWNGGAKRGFACLVNQMPDNAKILLDRCVVKSDGKAQSLDYQITYDFFLLNPTGSKPPMFDGLQAIIDNDDEQCLTHKLCKKYFSVKWREKGCYVYLANLFIFLCFHVSFNVYVALVRGAIAVRTLHKSNAATTKSTTSNNSAGRPNQHGAIVATTFIFILTFFNIFKEFVRMHTQRWRYFKKFSNYFEWMLYVCVLYFMFPVRNTKTERQFGAASLAVCISWFNLIWFLRRIPDIGTYILTLQKVFKTLTKMLLLIVLFCMAYASTFYLLLAEYSRFKNFPIAILSTFVSMLGDFKYDSLFLKVGYHTDFYDFKLLMFVMFVLLMVVVVNNVLIGLAVGDTTYVMSMAKVQSLRQHIKFIMEVESSLFGRLPCFKRKKGTTHTEYPNRKKSFTDNVNRFFAGEMNTFYNEDDEGDDEGGDDVLTQEKIEEMVQTRLENYHKKIMKELKDFHSDIVEKFGEMVN